MSVRPGPGDYVYVVRCRLVDASRSAEWNAWYDKVHVPGLLSVPGILSAHRFRDYEDDLAYMATYDITSPDVFDDPSYEAVRGWGPWIDYVADWSTEVVGRQGPREIER
jgi:hypothetical protein